MNRHYDSVSMNSDLIETREKWSDCESQLNVQSSVAVDFSMNCKKLQHLVGRRAMVYNPSWLSSITI